MQCKLEKNGFPYFCRYIIFVEWPKMDQVNQLPYEHPAVNQLKN